MSAITTHVLDTARGRPGAGLPVTLEVEAAGGWKL
ncbi:MAG: hydroxyisourate hydrolase, partial [Acidobacteria bacterium]